ncbi:sn-glycerol-3-phosphate ABC transporter ATP-binding protein UgpC [Devosia sp. YIM 151766]|uniref:ABC transporter ATP-binding protein n=1 Tax=Devosia sp. YIM 151766 TaxID=3017325 RepID=UPI00255CA23D|nr:sn-glycerol-3-phosphate ABC transporter ATP-binding protein UgpC [Devosia sp. YIM 151766]WIY52022.1 sn-glycerol-3-phosphate ABC transporter ATP-binding protein UgpC [Devosia sp. YIM 151766]
MAKVRIDGVRKSFGDVEVLKNIDIDITDGEFLVLVGPSGCGKSTLLRSIAGLEGITAGRIHIGEEDVTERPPKGRDVAMVFQNYALYPHMTVARNMGFSLELKRASRAEREAAVAKAAEILGLTPLLKRYPRQLSGGQRQRVAMGRAIVRNPQVFLFDEPLSNLDAKLRVTMRSEIKQLHQRLGSTIVYVTHDQVEAMTMADRIAVMHGGVLEQLGTPQELYERPANRFVATFIGSPSMNLIHGEVIAEGGQVLFRTIAGTLPLAPKYMALSGRSVEMGIRPENFVLADAGLSGTITQIDPMGAEQHLFIDVGGPQIVTIDRVRLDNRVGQTATIALGAHEPHFFDPDSGRRIDA